MPTHIPRDVQAVRAWIFDPLCTSAVEASTTLQRAGCAPGTGMGIDRQLVRLNDDGTVAPTSRFDEVPASYFLSNVAMGSATEALASRVDAAPQLTSVRGFDVQLVTSGESFSTPLQHDAVLAFVTSAKVDSNYFDFVVYSGTDNARATTYSRRDVIPGLRHSGDIGSLLHTVTVTPSTLQEDSPLVLGVVGYNTKPLMQFVNQVPFVCVPDMQRRTIYVVPCPLDEAAVGANTMACLMVGKRRGDEMLWTVLDAPRCSAGVDTNTMNDTVIACRDAAIANAAALVDSGAAQTRQTASTLAAAAIPTHACPVTTAVSAVPAFPCVLIAVEEGLDRVMDKVATLKVPRTHTPILVSFGNGLTVAAGRPGAAAPAVAAVRRSSSIAPVVLPLVSGTLLRGSSALALGSSYRVVSDAGAVAVTAAGYAAALQRAAVRIVHVSDTMLEQVRDTAAELVEGFFVIHVAKCTHANIEWYLNTINVSAVTSMAGPLSMVVVEMDGKRYWYRGVPWAGVLDRTPLFAERVTEELSDERVTRLCCEGAVAIPRSSYVKGTPDCYFAPQLQRDLVARPATAWIDALLALPYDVMPQQRPSCELLFAQLPVMLPANQLEPITATVIAHVHRVIDEQLAPLKSELEAAIKRKSDAATINEIGHRLHLRGREYRSKLQWLVDLVGRCISTTRSSTRAFDLNRLTRKTIISGNVTAAKSMTFTQVCDLLDRECHPDLGAAIAHFNSGAVSLLVRSISRGTFFKDRQTSPAYAVNATTPLIEMCPRMLVLDSVTVGALKESESSVTPLHSGSQGQVSLALVGLDKRPALPLPLFTRYVEAKDPTVFKWLDEANDPSIASLRILLRGTISACTESRSATISPSALDLGYGIVYVIVSAMLSLVGNGPCTSSMHPSFDDTKAQTMRGLFGLLGTTLASGQRPISPAWQLLSDAWRVEVPFPDHWWIYDGMLRCLPATGWHLPSLHAALRRLLVLVVRKHVTDAGVGSMRKRCTFEEYRAQANTDAEQRDAEYAATALLTMLLIHVSLASPSTVLKHRAAIATAATKHTAQTVRTASHRRGNATLHHLAHFFCVDLVASDLTAGTFTTALATACKVAARSVAERAAPFANSIEELRDALVVTAAPSTAASALKLRHQASMGNAVTTAALPVGDETAAVIPYAVGLLFGNAVSATALAGAHATVKGVMDLLGGVVATTDEATSQWNTAVTQALLLTRVVTRGDDSKAMVTAVEAAIVIPDTPSPSSSEVSTSQPSAVATPQPEVAAVAVPPPAPRVGKWKGWGPVVNIFPPKVTAAPPATQQQQHADPNTTVAPKSASAKAPRGGLHGNKKAALQPATPATVATPPAPKAATKGWGPVVNILPPKPQGHVLAPRAANATPTVSVGTKGTVETKGMAPTLRAELGETGFATPQALHMAATLDNMTVATAFDKLSAAERASVEAWFFAVSNGGDRDACLRGIVEAQLVHWSDEQLADAASVFSLLTTSARCAA